jgi:hypothetical protein
MDKPKVLKTPRGIAASSITSFGSFMIPRPILRTKGRALRAQLVLFILEVVFTVSAVLSTWVIFNLPTHGVVQTFSMTSAFLTPSTDPNNPNGVVSVSIVPKTAQGCAYAAIGLSVTGLLLTIVITYSTKIPEWSVKYLLGACVFCSIALFFVEVAAEAGFEANLQQLATVVSLTGSLQNVDYSGRGYGYASLVISWILAMPLFILSNTVFFGHLRGMWEHNWRETLRASWGQGIPDWLQKTIKDANSPPSGASPGFSAASPVGIDGEHAVVVTPFNLSTST